nr:hypothetical protein [Micromonospora sp. DSM 115978]
MADLMVEAHFYRAMHELAIVAWRRELTVEALLALTEVVEPSETTVVVEPAASGEAGAG